VEPNPDLRVFMGSEEEVILGSGRGGYPMKQSVVLIASTMLGAAMMTQPSFAQQPAKVGTLTCDISGGIGMIVTSKKTMACTFAPSKGGKEVYVGSINKFGLDIGTTNKGRMVWAVFAPTSRKAGALAGTYTGASAEATVGAGLGANVLVGGSDRTISLQPLSVQGQSGLNLAVGVSGLELHAR
jgi:hypothetical protein